MAKKSFTSFKLNGGYLFLAYGLASVLGHITGWLVPPFEPAIKIRYATYVADLNFLEAMEGVFLLPFSHISALFGASVVDGGTAPFTLAAWGSIVAAIVFFSRKDRLSLTIFFALIFFVSIRSLTVFAISA